MTILHLRNSLDSLLEMCGALFFDEFERISLHYTSDPKCRGWNTDLCLVVQ
jgi:hypothetical protein